MTAERRPAALLLAAGAAPFAAAACLPAGGPAACPFRAVTGVPCPLCGGVRAFDAAAAGDPGFVSFNGWWVLVAAALMLVGLVTLAVPRVRLAAGAALVFATPARAVLTLGVLAAGGWAWALAQSGSIAG